MYFRTPLISSIYKLLFFSNMSDHLLTDPTGIYSSIKSDVRI